MSERIAVVGGGIVGCVIVRELLAARPDAEIVLIERDLIGLGASARSAGVHFPIGRTERGRAMARASERYYAKLAAQDPSLPIYSVDFYAIVLDDMVEATRRNFIAPGAIKAAPPDRQGATAWPTGASIWHVPGCHYADVWRLTQRLAHDFRPAVALIEGVAVSRIEEEGDRVALILTTGESLSVDRVVLALGPWANAPTWRKFIEPLSVRVKKIVAFHLDRPIDDDDVAFFFPAEDAFILPLRYRGHWLYSFTCTEWDLHPDDPLPGVSQGNIDEARAVLRRYAPELVGTLRSGRTFSDAYGPAREPIVATIGDSGRIVFAGAASGSGYRLAPAIAAEALQLLNGSSIQAKEPLCG